MARIVGAVTVMLLILSLAGLTWGQGRRAPARFGAPTASGEAPAGETSVSLGLQPRQAEVPADDFTAAPIYRPILPEARPVLEEEPVPALQEPGTIIPVQVIPPAVLTPDKLLQEIETRNAELNKRVEELSKKYQELQTQVKENEKRLAVEERTLKEKKTTAFEGAFGQSAARTRKEPMYRIGWFFWRDDTREIAGREPYHADMAPLERHIAEGITFGDGLIWQSQDKYFKLIFHDLTQLDYREPIQQGDLLHGGFIIPRQRWYFNGKVGDYADFVTSINRGYGSLDVLDSYVDFNVNREYLKFRVGRFKMPSQYEYIDIAEGDLLGPERSLYVANFAANRQLGAMAHGYLFDRQIHYYTAVSNGPRRSFEDFNSSRDYFFYVDYMPFLLDDCSPLQYLHWVSAYNFGSERNVPIPSSIETLNQVSASASALTVSPIISQFNTNVIENGPRAFWSQELVYYYRSFGMLSGAQGGYQDYSVSKTGLAGLPGFQNSNNALLGVGSPTRTHVPIYGWTVGAWYFLTGEQITARRFLVEPVRPFGFYNGTINPGAWEVFGRFANLQLGSQVFSGGLIDPAKWTNRASAIDIGVNWYLTHYVKFSFDYQHTFLADSVILDPTSGRKTKDYDTFLFRTQLFF